MRKNITLDHMSFADPENGIVPFLAGWIKELISLQKDDELQKLVNDIAKTAEFLLELNDEVVEKRERFIQAKNKLEAMEKSLAASIAAKEALEQEMKEQFGLRDEEEPEDEIGLLLEQEIQELDEELLESEVFGVEDDEDDDEEEDLFADDYMSEEPNSQPSEQDRTETEQKKTEIAPTSSEPNTNEASSLQLQPAKPAKPIPPGREPLIDEPVDLEALNALTLDAVMDSSKATKMLDDELRAQGFVFGDEIDALGDKEDTDVDSFDSLYSSSVISDVDIDNGYQPIEEQTVEELDAEMTNMASSDDEDSFSSSVSSNGYDEVYDVLDFFEEDDEDMTDIENIGLDDDYDDTDELDEEATSDSIETGKNASLSDDEDEEDDELSGGAFIDVTGGMF